jgi:segregation and condensation protein B
MEINQDTSMDIVFVQNVIEVALLSSDRPLSLTELTKLFDEMISETDLLRALSNLKTSYATKWIELKEVAGGYRLQTKPIALSYLIRLKQEKPPRYSRAVLETLAIIVWKQPVTRGDIEEVRGVSVAAQIIKTLEERGWIESVGTREVPGRPVLYATTSQFLSDFGLKSLVDLPTVSSTLSSELREQESLPWADTSSQVATSNTAVTKNAN